MRLPSGPLLGGPFCQPNNSLNSLRLVRKVILFQSVTGVRQTVTSIIRSREYFASRGEALKTGRIALDADAIGIRGVQPGLDSGGRRQGCSRSGRQDDSTRAHPTLV